MSGRLRYWLRRWRRASDWRHATAIAIDHLRGLSFQMRQQRERPVGPGWKREVRRVNEHVTVVEWVRRVA